MTVGLFGTCGNSTWRKPFIELANSVGLEYFNPQVDNWTPDLADLETKHMKEDSVILFPVLDETDGLGSLAEIGFAVNTTFQTVYVFVAPKVDETKVTDTALIKASNRTRALVISKLENIRNRNLVLCTSMEDMYNKFKHEL